MIALAIPTLTDFALYRLLQQILRQAVDGTIKPLFVDYTNQRVIVGGTASAGSGAPLQVQSGDVEITTSGKGVIIKDDGGSGKTCRMTLTYDAASGNWIPTFTTVSALLLALSLAAPAAAANRGIVEGVRASNQTLFVDTTTSRLDVSTDSYSGGLSGVGLYVSSSVVISTDSSNKILLDANGKLRITVGGVQTDLLSQAGSVGTVGTASNHPFGFITNNVERGRFLAGGELGLLKDMTLYNSSFTVVGYTVTTGQAEFKGGSGKGFQVKLSRNAGTMTGYIGAEHTPGDLLGDSIQNEFIFRAETQLGMGILGTRIVTVDSTGFKVVRAIYLSSTAVSQAGTGAAITASSGCTQAVMAWSLDGSGVSTGTLVSLRTTADGHNGYLTFSSTTSASVAGPLGIIVHSSAPASAFSAVCVRGLARVLCGTGAAVGQGFVTSTTRGVAGNSAAAGLSVGGIFMETQSSGSDGWCTVWLGGAGGG